MPPCEAETIQQLYESAHVDDEVMAWKERIEFNSLRTLFFLVIIVEKTEGVKARSLPSCYECNETVRTE